MPIATTCPACHHAYRLKDELAGKRVKCKNPGCQETFTVPRSAHSPAVTVAPTMDADSVAAQAFAEDQFDAAPTDSRTITMTCTSCDHKWAEAWDKQGKNVLCPECRQRQKVPLPQATKAADWRSGRGGPSLAKQPELEGVTSSGNAGYVSGEALRGAGLGRPELEPRPLWQKVAIVALPLTVIATVVLGVQFFQSSQTEAEQAALMAAALDDLPDPAANTLPRSEVPPARAALLIAAGRYNIRRANDGEIGVTEAVKMLERARQELDQAPVSPARDFLWGELVAAQLLLGGNSEQVNNDRKIRWIPQAAGVGPARVSEKVYSVQDELRRTFEAMKLPDRPVPLDVRLAVFRQAARVFQNEGLTNAAGQLIATLFTDDGAVEAGAQNAVEQYRASGDAAVLEATVAGMVATLAERKAGPTLLAVAQLSANPPAELKLAPLTPAGDDRVRQAHGIMALLKKDASGAIAVAKQPGKLAPRLALLALATEWSDEPTSMVTAAAEVLAAEAGNNDVGVAPDHLLVRLASNTRAATAATTERFAAATGRDDTKVLVRAVAANAIWREANVVQAESEWNVPAEASAIRFGHLWGRLNLARVNAAAGEVKSPGAFDSWGPGAGRPFGLAGAALGQHDRTAQ